MSEDKQYSTSPERGSFYRGVWEKQLKEGKITQELYDNMIKILDESRLRAITEDKGFNLAYDLRSSPEILNKARNSEVYCQNLYAALCNNRFFYGDKEWTCSWRYAGGIIADMRQEGDYIDWYATGHEGQVTDEVRLDLIKLGWVVKPYEDDDLI